MIELSIILPAHNQADIIEPAFKNFFKSIRKTVKYCEFILVENGSWDNSLEIVKLIAKTYPDTRFLVTEKGPGRAVSRGIDNARGKLVCYMASDGQIDLKVFARLWQETTSGKWDLVKIKRITRESLLRSVIQKLFSITMFVVFGMPYLDVNGTPKIFEKSKFRVIALESNDEFLDAEFLIKAVRLGWSIKEVPMKTLARLGGKSKRSVKTFFGFFANIYRFKIGKNLVEWQRKYK